MPQYTVDKAFWLKSNKQAVGSVVSLTESQAKYLGHAVTKVEDKPAPAAAPVTKKAAKKADGVAVTEQSEAPADGAGN